MYILGISDSHESHASLIKNGKLIACIAEERLNRIKGFAGYPKLAIDKVLKIGNISPRKLEHVVFAGFNAGLFHLFTKPSCLWKPKDWINQHYNYWKPKLINNKKLTPLDDFNFDKKKIKNIKSNPYYDFLIKIKGKKYNQKTYYDILKKVRLETAAKHLKINKNKITFIKHETCHQFYGY